MLVHERLFQPFFDVSISDDSTFATTIAVLWLLEICVFECTSKPYGASQSQFSWI